MVRPGRRVRAAAAERSCADRPLEEAFAIDDDPGDPSGRHETAPVVHRHSEREAPTLDRFEGRLGHDLPAERRRRQMVELVLAGRKFADLAQEFGCTGWSIRQWVKQAERDAGRGDGGLTSEDRQELSRLRRENRQLKLEREILSKAAAWFAKESTATPKRSSDS